MRDVAGESLPHGSDFALFGVVMAPITLPTNTGVVSGTMAAWNSGDNLLDAYLMRTASWHLASVTMRLLDDESLAALIFQSPVQGLMVALGYGNEKAYTSVMMAGCFFGLACNPWLKQGFLDEAQLFKRGRISTAQPDPIKGIVHFRDQLAARGIELVLVPALIKPNIYPEYFSLVGPQTEAMRNRSMEQFMAAMTAENITVVEPLPT